MAWLNTAPKPDKKPSGKGEAPTRIEAMKADGISPTMPDNPLPHIVSWLLEVGPTVPAGMGSGPIGWRDIEAWSSLTGVGIQPWEARLLRRLSGDFLSQRQKAEKPDCPAPWVDDAPSVSNREAVSRKIGAEFKAIMMAQRGKSKPD